MIPTATIVEAPTIASGSKIENRVIIASLSFIYFSRYLSPVPWQNLHKVLRLLSNSLLLSS